MNVCVYMLHSDCEEAVNESETELLRVIPNESKVMGASSFYIAGMWN